jgi:peptidoglycan/xylan/chitin deacetylase (PgdA/CDA1 family)
VRGAHYMSLEQVLDLQTHGHELGGHTLDHPHLPTLTGDAQKVEICNDRAALLGLGIDARNFAYPFGEADAVTEAAAQFCNYNSARGVGDLRDASGNAVLSESFTPPDLFKIRANSSVYDYNTLADIQNRVLGAEQGGGGWVSINIHHICDTCGVNQIHPPIFAGLLDWLQAHIAGTSTYVRKMRQMLPGDAKPPVQVEGLVEPDAGDGVSPETLSFSGHRDDALGDEVPE